MNSKAMHKLSYGLYLISAAGPGKDTGCIANTLQQVTSSPAQLSITLNKDNFTEQVIAETGFFNAVVLTEQINMDIIRTFGFQSGKDVDKYEQVPFERDCQGIPYITEHAAAFFTCKVVNRIDVGTHVMFIGEVIDCDTLCSEESMTYAYYHKVKNGTTPPNAPGYQKESEKTGWRCNICGYIYEGDPLPDGFICPVCKAGASSFEKTTK